MKHSARIYHFLISNTDKQTAQVAVVAEAAETSITASKSAVLTAHNGHTILQHFLFRIKSSDSIKGATSNTLKT